MTMKTKVKKSLRTDLETVSRGTNLKAHSRDDSGSDSEIELEIKSRGHLLLPLLLH